MKQAKPKFPNLLTRREFVRRSAWGAATSLTIPAFLQQTLFNLDARAQTIPPLGEEGPILLIIELAGGNDALNTVIPFSNSIYSGARPTLGLGLQQGLHQIGQTPSVAGGDEPLALHPNLQYFKTLWDQKEAAIINGVGYPNPNLSHFTSFDYWHSAEPNSVVKDGWLGRYFDSQCQGCPATYAIELSGRPTTAFSNTGSSAANISITDAESFNWRDLGVPGRETSLEALYRKLIGLDNLADDGIEEHDDILSFVQRASHNAMISTKSVYEANQASGGLLYGDWPNSSLANDLKQFAQLIRGGINTSIYYAHQGGYDTHNNQILNGNNLTGRHSALLQELDEAVHGFVEEMKLQGVWDRMLILTFSEFGRKVIENGSAGTDHGAAESLFVMGGQVKGGFYGLFPDLAADARVKRDSVAYNVDFRSVYRTVLQNWMQVPSEAMNEIFPSQPANFDVLNFL